MAVASSPSGVNSPWNAPAPVPAYVEMIPSGATRRTTLRFCRGRFLARRMERQTDHRALPAHQRHLPWNTNGRRQQPRVSATARRRALLHGSESNDPISFPNDQLKVRPTSVRGEAPPEPLWLLISSDAFSQQIDEPQERIDGQLDPREQPRERYNACLTSVDEYAGTTLMRNSLSNRM